MINASCARRPYGRWSRWNRRYGCFANAEQPCVVMSCSVLAPRMSNSQSTTGYRFFLAVAQVVKSRHYNSSNDTLDPLHEGEKPMVPPDYSSYFGTMATVAATLFGLIFLVVSITPESIASESAPLERQLKVVAA